MRHFVLRDGVGVIIILGVLNMKGLRTTALCIATFMQVKKSHACELSGAGCATALVGGLMSHTITPSSCPLCVFVYVCKQRQLVSGH